MGMDTGVNTTKDITEVGTIAAVITAGTVNQFMSNHRSTMHHSHQRPTIRRRSTMHRVLHQVLISFCHFVEARRAFDSCDFGHTSSVRPKMNLL